MLINPSLLAVQQTEQLVVEDNFLSDTARTEILHVVIDSLGNDVSDDIPLDITMRSGEGYGEKDDPYCNVTLHDFLSQLRSNCVPRPH